MTEVDPDVFDWLVASNHVSADLVKARPDPSHHKQHGDRVTQGDITQQANHGKVIEKKIIEDV